MTLLDKIEMLRKRNQKFGPLTHEDLVRDHFEAYEAFILHNDDLFAHGTVRFVYLSRLEACLPGFPHKLGWTRTVWWKPDVGIWVRYCRGISSYPRREDRTEVIVRHWPRLAHEWWREVFQE